MKNITTFNYYHGFEGVIRVTSVFHALYWRKTKLVKTLLVETFTLSPCLIKDLLS